MNKKIARKIMRKTLVNNGYTYNPTGGRYCVAIEGQEKIIELNKFNEQVILQYAKNIIKGTLGTWVHEGKVYLDNTELFNNLDEAIKTGKQRKQLAIFDLEKMEEILIK